MAIDVEKRVQTTFTIVDRATGNMGRMSKAMQGMARSTSNAKRMLRSFNATQGRTTRGVAASTRTTQQLTSATRRASTSHRQFRSEINNVRYSLLGLAAAAAGFFAVMESRKIIRISDDFEQTRLAMDRRACGIS